MFSVEKCTDADPDRGSHLDTGAFTPHRESRRQSSECADKLGDEHTKPVHRRKFPDLGKLYLRDAASADHRFDFQQEPREQAAEDKRGRDEEESFRPLLKFLHNPVRPETIQHGESHSEDTDHEPRDGTDYQGLQHKGELSQSTEFLRLTDLDPGLFRKMIHRTLFSRQPGESLKHKERRLFL